MRTLGASRSLLPLKGFDVIAPDVSLETGGWPLFKPSGLKIRNAEIIIWKIQNIKGLSEVR